MFRFRCHMTDSLGEETGSVCSKNDKQINCSSKGLYLISEGKGSERRTCKTEQTKCMANTGLNELAFYMFKYEKMNSYSSEIHQCHNPQKTDKVTT